jgi:glycolate oxidase iron-sulfur subunit
MTLDPELLDDCVHCGFCLPACPTYDLWGEEMDSPRGRIDLMRQLKSGGPLTDAVVGHFDACLGCLACVPACPSGVRYDRLIEETRELVEESRPRSRRERLVRAMIFALFPYPRRLAAARPMLALYRRSGLSRLVRPLLERLSPPVAAMERLAPPITSAPRLPARVAARGTRRAVVGMLTGCVQGAFFPQVNTATARVLAMEGCDVVIPPHQGCCGALSLHSGRGEEGRKFARRTIRTFEKAGVDTIVVNSAGCGSAMKDYEDILAGDPKWAARAAAMSAKVRDLSEFLVELGPVAPRHELRVRIAYHAACHLAHGQGVRDAPRELLRGVPGLELREIADGEMCCGSAGVYNLLQPETARELGPRTAATGPATGAALLVSANPGCALQIGQALERRGGDALTQAHIAEVLDASMRGMAIRGSKII